MVTLRITNATRNSVLATAANIATTPDYRRIGLLGHSALLPGEGMFFPECNAVHTMGMDFCIDIVFVDMLTHRVKKLGMYVCAGNRLEAAIPREICAVLEVPAGTVELTGTRCGDVIVVLSSSHASQEELNRVGAMRW